MITLGQSMFTSGDWLTAGLFLVAQTIAIVVAVTTAVWKVASRIQSLEAKVDMLVASEIAALKERIGRIENQQDARR